MTKQIPTEIKVINIKNYENSDYIYIGRPSKYGNPYSSKETNIAVNVESKEESLCRYEEHIDENPKLIDDIIKEMNTGKISKLGCWCSPKKCHGDIIAKKINDRKYKSLF